MTPLRLAMIEAMSQRGFAPRTHQSYLGAITDLARYTHLSPERLEQAQLEAYFRHLAVERRLSASTCRQHLAAVRFLYRQVLGRQDLKLDIPVPKSPQRIPELLTTAEVARILGACHNLKHQAELATCYGCGLRLNELVHLKGNRPNRTALP